MKCGARLCSQRDLRRLHTYYSLVVWLQQLVADVQQHCIRPPEEFWSCVDRYSALLVHCPVAH
jgi:hypothetical protein